MRTYSIWVSQFGVYVTVPEISFRELIDELSKSRTIVRKKHGHLTHYYVAAVSSDDPFSFDVPIGYIFER